MSEIDSGDDSNGDDSKVYIIVSGFAHLGKALLETDLDYCRRNMIEHLVNSNNDLIGAQIVSQWLGLAERHDGGAANDNETRPRIGYLEIDDPCAPPSEPQ